MSEHNRLRGKERPEPVVVNETYTDDILVRVDLWNTADGDGVATLHWDIPQSDGTEHRYTEDFPQSAFPAEDVAAVTALLDRLVVWVAANDAAKLVAEAEAKAEAEAAAETEVAVVEAPAVTVG
jgi:hypothetical protein